MVRRGASVDPALPPGAEPVDHPVELPACLGQPVVAAAPHGHALDHARVLQMAQTLREQGP
jgi:hypothetical protein